MLDMQYSHTLREASACRQSIRRGGGVVVQMTKTTKKKRERFFLLNETPTSMCCSTDRPACRKNTTSREVLFLSLRPAKRQIPMDEKGRFQKGSTRESAAFILVFDSSRYHQICRNCLGVRRRDLYLHRHQLQHTDFESSSVGSAHDSIAYLAEATNSSSSYCYEVS